MNIPSIEGYNLFNETANEIVSGGFSLKPVDILNNITKEIFNEVQSFSKTAAIILVMALLSSTVGTLNSSLGENSGGRAAFFTFFTVISGLALSCFGTALSYGTEVVGHMTSFMNKLTPVLILSLFTCCKSISAAAFEPVLSGAVYVMSIVIEKCLVPLMTFSAVLSVAGNIGETTSISGFIKIVKSITKWLMAFVITLFTGINAIYGFSASSLDAVSAKTIKFAVGSLVPVVGGFLSDTLDTVTTSAGLIKNAVGVSGIIIMCGICIVPVIKLGVMQLLLKLCAAMAEPVTDKRISGMLWSISEAVTSVFGVVILTAVLFVVNICIILRATG
ncbi:MAG: stage III sporulation protein AE [Oscillospiraceae bacterium]|nr:stage III sporulation protein AE [Oscillospiraceae bacterium]